MRARLACLFAAALLAGAPAVAVAAGGQPQVVEPATGTPAPSVQDPGTIETAPPATPAPTLRPAQPGAQASDGGRDWPLIVLAALGACVLALALLAALGAWRGWDPPWLRRWRHAVAEAGYRASLGWAELRDLLRLGR